MKLIFKEYCFELIISFSNNKSIKSLSVWILISDHASICSSILCCSPLYFQKSFQVLEKSHLLSIIFRVVLDVLLMGFKILNDVFLLSQLCIEEILVAFKFICQFLIRLVNELSFVSNSLQECIVDLSLNVIEMVFSLIISVVIECLLHIWVESSFFLI